MQPALSSSEMYEKLGCILYKMYKFDVKKKRQLRQKGDLKCLQFMNRI